MSICGSGGSLILHENAELSTVEDGIGVGGSRGLRLISTGFCVGVCPSSQTVSFGFVTGDLDVTASYRLSLDCRHVSGSTGFFGRMLRGVGVSIASATLTPGKQNDVGHISGRALSEQHTVVGLGVGRAGF